LESKTKSFLKTLSWRLIATLTTILVAYFIIGDVSAALAIGGVEFFIKMVVYYLHERAWSKVE
jgi:uncharacterized membrane protein|tara:strand:+ start:87 stop:275 length:189 start_codon:yes stop_codon:yes gene_type:complete